MDHDGDFELMVSKDDADVAYVRLPGHPGPVPGVVKRSVSLRDLIGEYAGPDLNFDFDKDNKLIGIEILG